MPTEESTEEPTEENVRREGDRPPLDPETESTFGAARRRREERGDASRAGPTAAAPTGRSTPLSTPSPPSEEGSRSAGDDLSSFLRARLERQARRMVDYLIAQGIEHPPIGTKPDTAEGLIDYYNALAERIRPATPRLLAEVDSPEERRLHDRNSAWMTGIFTGLALLALVGTGWTLVELGSAVSTQITQLETAPQRVAKIFFGVSVAALGAILAVFTQIQTFVTKNIYNKRYNTTYVVKFVSGVIAGFILAELLSVTLGPPASTATEATAGLLDFGVGAAALIGGAFAPVVYNVIKRLSEMTERVFVDRAAAREAEMRRTLELRAALQTYRARQRVSDRFAAYRAALEAIDPDLAEKLDAVAEGVLVAPLHPSAGANGGPESPSASTATDPLRGAS